MSCDFLSFQRDKAIPHSFYTLCVMKQQGPRPRGLTLTRRWGRESPSDPGRGPGGAG